MTRALRLLLALALLSPAVASAIDAQAAFGDPVMQARYEALVDELRCLVCQNQTIADSDAPLAQDLRAQVREMLGDGASDAEILAFMTDRYGDFVRYRPAFSPRTYAVWLGPFVLLAIGLAVVVRVVARRTEMPIDDEPELTAEPPGDDAPPSGDAGTPGGRAA
ncbi:MAG: cytochrome c-type biogenesis protein [Pseudomonadota bacterium]